jgi:ADP-ribosyl-[dinitrogen reductase] hydrolase
MMSSPTYREQIEGGLIGLLVGDAVGVPYEFHPPAALPELDLIDMAPPAGFSRAHGGVPTGTWSDDGAQALCLLASLLERDGFDLVDFSCGLLNWLDHGFMAVDGQVFDVGNQTSEALRRLRSGHAAERSGLSGERHNGNGSLMRVLPLMLWHTGDDSELFHLAMRQSLPTHGHLRSQLACGMYCLWARHLLRGTGDWNEALLDAAHVADQLESARAEWPLFCHELDRVPTGTGYVMDSLISARHALGQGKDYASVVRHAIALGNDTDTTAAIAGGLAGIRYGLRAIPPAWLNALRGRNLLEPLIEKLLAHTAAAAAHGNPKQSGATPSTKEGMDKILAAFAEQLGALGLKLDPTMVGAERGVIEGAGWVVQWCIGADDRGPHLDYYSAHRMTDDYHVRIRYDGTLEELEGYQAGHPLSSDPAVAALHAKLMRVHNKAVASTLHRKGFTNASMTMQLLGAESGSADAELVEKDLDEALAIALRGNQRFADWLLSQTPFDKTSARVDWVRADNPWTTSIVQTRDSETGEITARPMQGETDVLAVYETNDGVRIGLHIENKMSGASFRTLQAERYRSRAQQWVGNPKYGNYSHWLTVVIAPKSVQRKAPDQISKFDVVIDSRAVGAFVRAYALCFAA